jgi:Transglycosylase SLT domain
VSNQDLMQSIKAKWGAMITAACKVSSVPEAFLAALIANESGGDPNAKRFESHVLLALWEVLLGRKASYGSIGRSMLVGFVSGVSPQPVQVPASLPADTYQRLDSLATSWGLTQVMGFNVIEQGSVDKLKDPQSSLHVTTVMLGQFVHRFQLDPITDFPPMFACWNTGGPDPAKTFDPNYVPNGLERMKIYAALVAADTDPGS